MSIEETGNFTLPSNPDDRQDIKDSIEEMANALLQIDSFREHINTIVADLHEKYGESTGIPKATYRKWAQMLHKGTFEKENVKTNSIMDNYELLMKNGG